MKSNTEPLQGDKVDKSWKYKMSYYMSIMEIWRYNIFFIQRNFINVLSNLWKFHHYIVYPLEISVSAILH